MSMMQTLVLNQLVHNADYFGKVLPHLKKDYFDTEPSRILFATIDGFAQEYNNQPTPDALAIIVNDLKISEGIWDGVIDLMGEIEKPVVGQNYDWLIKETEKWMRDRAVYNVITDSVDIYSNPTRRGELGEIPSRMEEALVVGFDDDLGMIYWEMAGEQYDYMHTDVNRIPFTVDILNKITNGGVWRKSLSAINAGINVGKAQPLTSKLLTPTGWKMMGDIRVGDFVIGKDGNKTKVLDVYPQGEKDVYELTFWDGRKTRCCEEHLWKIYKGGMTEEAQIVDLKEFKRLLELKKYATKNNRLYIDLPDAVNFEKNETLKLDPYLLGALLGDGCMTIKGGSVCLSNPDQHIVERCKDALKQYGCTFTTRDIDHAIVKVGREIGVRNPVKQILKDIGVYGCYSYDKFIPEEYLFASVEDRIALLQGLMDTDGYCGSQGACEYYTTSEKLKDGVETLVRSLGGMTNTKLQYVPGHHDCYRVGVRFRPGFDVFSLPRKAERCKNRVKPLTGISIETIKLVGKEECQCIRVDNEDHLYITDDFIVTHNTTGLVDLAAQYASQGLNVVYFTFEVTEKRIRHRMDCRVLERDFETVEALDRHQYVASIEQKFNTKTYGQIFIKEFDSGAGHAGHCRAYVKDLIKRRGIVPDIMLFDYVGEMASERLPFAMMSKSDLYYGSIARELRSLVFQFNAVGWTALQFQRGMQNTKEMSLDGNADSITVPKVLDFQLGLAIPDEYAQLNQAWGTVLKNRFANKAKMKNFIIGLNNDKQMLYDVDAKMQTFSAGELNQGPRPDTNNLNTPLEEGVGTAPLTSLRRASKSTVTDGDASQLKF